MCCSFMAFFLRKKCSCFPHIEREYMNWKMFICSLDVVSELRWICHYSKIPQLAYFCHKQLRPPCSPSVFLHCSDERSDHANLFSKDVVMVAAHPLGNLAPWLLPSWRHEVACTQRKHAAALVLITQRLIVQDKLLHAPFTAWLQRGPGYLAWCVR